MNIDQVLTKIKRYNILRKISGLFLYIMTFIVLGMYSINSLPIFILNLGRVTTEFFASIQNYGLIIILILGILDLIVFLFVFIIICTLVMLGIILIKRIINLIKLSYKDYIYGIDNFDGIVLEEKLLSSKLKYYENDKYVYIKNLLISKDLIDNYNVYKFFYKYKLILNLKNNHRVVVGAIKLDKRSRINAVQFNIFDYHKYYTNLVIKPAVIKNNSFITRYFHAVDSNIVILLNAIFIAVILTLGLPTVILVCSYASFFILRILNILYLFLDTIFTSINFSVDTNQILNIVYGEYPLITFNDLAVDIEVLYDLVVVILFIIYGYILIKLVKKQDLSIVDEISSSSILLAKYGLTNVYMNNKYLSIDDVVIALNTIDSLVAYRSGNSKGLALKLKNGSFYNLGLLNELTSDTDNLKKYINRYFKENEISSLYDYYDLKKVFIN